MLANATTQNQGDIPKSEQPNLYLLEFDERFNVFPEFVFYDFKSPFKLPRES
jgi:hypothetical protein